MLNYWNKKNIDFGKILIIYFNFASFAIKLDLQIFLPLLSNLHLIPFGKETPVSLLNDSLKSSTESSNQHKTKLSFFPSSENK